MLCVRVRIHRVLDHFQAVPLQQMRLTHPELKADSGLICYLATQRPRQARGETASGAPAARLIEDDERLVLAHGARRARLDVPAGVFDQPRGPAVVYDALEGAAGTACLKLGEQEVRRGLELRAREQRTCRPLICSRRLEG
jgi:hypothetical protein